jgi:hypothetical protein
LVTTNVTVSPADTVILLGSNLVVVEGGDLDRAGRLTRVGRPANATRLLLTTGGRCVATSAQVAIRAVAAATGEQHDDSQQDQDDDDDPKHLHPAWCPRGPIHGRSHTGVGGAGRVSHRWLLSSRVAGEFIQQFTRQYVSVKS